MTADEIYHFIGQTIVDSITEDWRVAMLHIERQHKYTGIKGEYENSKEIISSMDDSLLGYHFSTHIHQLHSITTESGHNRWNKLNFVLYPGGKFEMDFIWDQTYQDEIDLLNSEN